MVLLRTNRSKSANHTDVPYMEMVNRARRADGVPPGAAYGGCGGFHHGSVGGRTIAGGYRRAFAGEEPIDHTQKNVLREGKSLHPIMERVIHSRPRKRGTSRSPSTCVSGCRA